MCVCVYTLCIRSTCGGLARERCPATLSLATINAPAKYHDDALNGMPYTARFKEIS